MKRPFTLYLWFARGAVEISLGELTKDKWAIASKAITDRKQSSVKPDLVFACCQLRYSSTRAWARGSFGYQWSSTLWVEVRYLRMATDSMMLCPLCSITGTVWNGLILAKSSVLCSSWEKYINWGPSIWNFLERLMAAVWIRENGNFNPGKHFFPNYENGQRRAMMI